MMNQTKHSCLKTRFKITDNTKDNVPKNLDFHRGYSHSHVIITWVKKSCLQKTHIDVKRNVV